MAEQYNILIADDDRDYVQCLTVMLEASGYSVTSASTGAECVAAARKHKPDLIILDIIMERLVSGLHVGYELRADPDLKDVPVIMISAIQEKTGFDVGSAKGSEYLAADEFINKPVKPKVLLDTIARLVKKRVG